MSDNWLRKCTLLITDKGGRTLDLSNLRCVFTVQMWTTSQWGTAVFKIYNLSANTANAIQAGEFANIQLIAGYRDNSGTLFYGQIRYSSLSRENNTDTLVTIQAVDCYDAKVFATVNHTLGKGYDALAVDAIIMKTLEPYGVSQGMTAKMPDTKFPRGKCFFGHSSAYQTQLGKQCGFHWQFTNGQRVSIPVNAYINNAIILNGNTGLIDLPKQTIKDSVIIRCLINPNIQQSSLIKLDQTSAQQASLNNVNFLAANTPLVTKNKDGTYAPFNAPDYASGLNTSGIYIVKSISCQGDTMGNDWYMDLTCAASNDLQAASSQNLSKS